MSELSSSEIERYSRQLILKDWSTEKQLSLRAIRVLVEDTFPSAAMYLAAAGVGSIIIRGESTEELVSHLRALNPDIEVTEAADDEPERDFEISSRVIPLPPQQSQSKALQLGALAAASIINEALNS